MSYLLIADTPKNYFVLDIYIKPTSIRTNYLLLGYGSCNPARVGGIPLMCYPQVRFDRTNHRTRKNDLKTLNVTFP